MQNARTQVKTQSRTKRRFSQDQITAIAMVAPSIIAIAIFVYGFIAWSGFVSLVNWNSLKPDFTFVGLENYAQVFSMGRFQTNVRNLFVFTIFFLIACLVIGLGLALMVDAKVKGEAIFRSVYIFPMALSFIVTGVVWQWIFAPGNYQGTPPDPTGINLLFHRLGLDFLMGDWTTDSRIVPGIRWLKTRLFIPMAMIPVVIAAVWQMSGFTMAMYLAGLRGIPEELREAALVDGCTELQVFRFITFPLLRPITLSAVIILGHISLKIFDLVVTMTGGAPGNNTEVPGLFMYELTFKANKFSQGAAVAMVMLVLVALLVVPYLLSNRESEAEQ
jgi:glucose/mannose transport system permease protein